MTFDIDHLADVFARLRGVALAVSGGVDSLTLAHVASLVLADFEVVHAISPAVPKTATERVNRHAAAKGWRLVTIDAGEFSDPDYLSNPVNRCYFCKTNLYGRMREVIGDRTIASGTNLDDLEDFRPGLAAASEAGVVHPFVEAGLRKAAVREIARTLGLEDIAELPAQPCLASRVETGLIIEPAALKFADEIEEEVRRHLPGADIRCRITHDGVRLEASAPPSQDVIAAIAKRCTSTGRTWLGIADYRRGSAFRHEVR